jgi:fluoride exporter
MSTLVGKMALVAVGGGLGAVARYGLDVVVSRMAPALAGRFPIGILLVNTLGCLAFGLICGLSGDFRHVSQARRLLLLTGLLGGFTTFSTFGHDTARLVTEGSISLAALNAGASVGLGVSAVFVGLWVGQRLAGA